MATPLSLRFKEDTLQRLYFQAKMAGVPPRTLAQRMVEEAIRMTEHPLIDFTENGPARRAFLRGTGLEVWELMGIVKAHGGDVAAAAESTGRTTARIRMTSTISSRQTCAHMRKGALHTLRVWSGSPVEAAP